MFVLGGALRGEPQFDRHASERRPIIASCSCSTIHSTVLNSSGAIILRSTCILLCSIIIILLLLFYIIIYDEQLFISCSSRPLVPEFKSNPAVGLCCCVRKPNWAQPRCLLSFDGHHVPCCSPWRRLQRSWPAHKCALGLAYLTLRARWRK